MVERVIQTEDVVSRARRIRSTRHFFPASTGVLRAWLFADLDAEELAFDGEVPDLDDNTAPPEKSSWILYEQAPFSHDVQDYQDRRHSALADSLTGWRERKSLFQASLLITQLVCYI